MILCLTMLCSMFTGLESADADRQAQGAVQAGMRFTVTSQV